MKVSRGLANPLFIPFTLNITVESEDEARALFAMFTLPHNTKLFENFESCEIVRNVIGNQHATRIGSEVIANNVTDAKYYKFPLQAAP